MSPIRVTASQSPPLTCTLRSMSLMSCLLSVFLVAATSTFVRFMHFKFGSQYRHYLDAKSERQQQRLVDQDGRDNDTFVGMESSEWYNLQSSEGRKAAICHTLALLRWHELEFRVPQTEPVLDNRGGDQFGVAIDDDTN